MLFDELLFALNCLSEREREKSDEVVEVSLFSIL